ncbi:MAG TPA: gamma-glutamylcyclotransferase [Burkholderiales bacterium]|nr:gamma-glutamylcyclotransferase [Burkholderiales bacterium]
MGSGSASGDERAVERGDSFVGEGAAAAQERQLCRADLLENALRRALEQSPLARELLPEVELEASLREALGSPHRQPDVWLFAYGSLIWNPVLEFDERVVATAHGWHRSFCLWSRVNRGTPDRPGLVLGLDRGGRCTGVVYRIPARMAEQELRLLWRREMLLGSYAPRWVLATHGKRTIRALAFIVQRGRSGYAGRLAAEAVADHLVHARGKIGTGIDYLRQTIDGLAAIGIRDPNLMHVDALIRARLGEDEPHRPRADLQL